MKRLVIIGAGGFGREVLGYALDMIDANMCDWEVAGFLDDDLNALSDYELEFKILGTIKDHEVNEKYVYICAIGNPIIKKKVCERFLEQQGNFVNIIHPTARMGRTNSIGIGTVLCPNAVLTENVTIGDFVFINCHSNCGHDSVVGDYSTISVFCDVTGFVTIGEGAFLGSHASICPGLKVGKFSKVGAGACVIEDIPDHVTAVGVPAKVIKRMDVKE